MYTICGYIVPITAVDRDFPLIWKRDTHVTRGMVYIKCVYTVPIFCSRCMFFLDLERDTEVVRGTMHTKCVYIVPITAVDTDLPLPLKEILRL